MGREKHKSPFIETEDEFSQFNSVNIEINENREVVMVVGKLLSFIV